MKHLLILSLILMALVGSASAAFNHADYTYSEDFFVNSTTAQTNYQVKMILSNATDYSATELWYTNGTTRDDWLDVAWTDTSNNLLPFWNETASYTITNSSWWINISSIANDNTTEIRVHYGDADAAESYADEDGTFMLIDDFPGTSGVLPNITKWTSTKLGSASATLELTGRGEVVLEGQNAVTSSANIVSNKTFSTPFIIQSRDKISSPNLAYGDTSIGRDSALSGSGGAYYWHTSIKQGYAWESAYYYSVSDYLFRIAADGSTTLLEYSSPGTSSNGEKIFHDADVWYIHQFIYTGTNVSAKNNPYYNPSSTYLFLPFSDSTHESPFYIHFSQGEYNAQPTYAGNRTIDWIFVRKYVAVEPFLTHKPTEAGDPPIASFTADINFIRIPGTITLTDTSTETPTSWNWSFGDGTYSEDENPVHKYTKRGAWDIILTATNDAGSDESDATTVRVIGYETYQ